MPTTLTRIPQPSELRTEASLSNDNFKAHLLGGGIGSMAAAAFMIRDGGMPGPNITIYDAASVLGGSLDAGGNPETGYSFRGGRMLTVDNYECTWGLFRGIPSLTDPTKSVYDETVTFNEKFKSHSQARLVDKHRAKVPVSSMGFSAQDRIELAKLATASEDELGASRITDWLSPQFFETEFWFMWVTTFAFQPWHSAVELKRYFNRFMLEFSRIETLAGVKRTVYNQYDSFVLPLKRWLESEGVQFVTGCTISALEHKEVDHLLTIAAFTYLSNGNETRIELNSTDLVFLQNGSMTDASSIGSMTEAPEKRSKKDCISWALWENLAEGRPELGNPSAFNSSIPESCWESFTITLKDTRFFEWMQELSGNEAGTGGLVTFKDSNWLMSIVLPHQPHFPNQPLDVQVFWGYALFPDRVGNFVPKPMEDCNGSEILKELCGHLRFDLEVVETAICLPCRMPYITSMFMPRAKGDRPLPVPRNTKNLGLISQFVEIAEDTVFTVEYSVRAAQTAVYQLLKIDREIPPITPHNKSLGTDLAVLIKAFK